jgi:hypothetical protein
MFALATLKGTATAYSFQASDRDPPMYFGVSASSAVPSVAFLSSSLIALTMSDRR